MTLPPDPQEGEEEEKGEQQQQQQNLDRAQELCESRGGRPGLPVPNSPYGLCERKATLHLKATTVKVRSVFHSK